MYLTIVRMLVLTITSWSDGPGAVYSELIDNWQAVESIDHSWRNARSCGPNSLYLFLRLNDIEVQHSTIMESIKIKEDGCSMADLKNCSSALGCPAVVVRCGAEDLARVRLPAIVHFSNLREGHFAVLLHVDVANESVLLGDGNACEIKSLPLAYLQQNWSGHLLITRFHYLCLVVQQLSVPVATITAFAALWLVVRILRRRFRTKQLVAAQAV